MAAQQHRHQSCRDKDCERPYCRIWKEAWAEAYAVGYQDGEVAGFAAGVAAASGD